MKHDDSQPRKVRQKYSPQFKDQVIERAAKDGVYRTVTPYLSDLLLLLEYRYRFSILSR